MIFQPERHEALNCCEWDEDQAREMIGDIVRDTESRHCARTFWPPHPLDVGERTQLSHPLTTLYNGACGVIWALRYLDEVGTVGSVNARLDELPSLLTAHRAAMDTFQISNRASYMIGDTAILMLMHDYEPRTETLDLLASLIEANIDNPTLELMWGSPGTMLASLFLFERTAEERWANLFRRSADVLWSSLELSAQHECSYWSQKLYGETCVYLGAVHGFAGNAGVIVRGKHLLDEEKRNRWLTCIADTVSKCATFEGDAANWKPVLDLPSGRSLFWLMQICHGGPGVTAFLARELVIDSPTLLAAGNAIWLAGPLRKGSNLCHGTGGNGYALLAIYQRTGERIWLDRARAFAMHGILQTRAVAKRYGQFRYALWTGDLGFAIYLHDCIRAEAAFPTLDVFF